MRPIVPTRHEQRESLGNGKLVIVMINQEYALHKRSEDSVYAVNCSRIRDVKTGSLPSSNFTMAGCNVYTITSKQ